MSVPNDSQDVGHSVSPRGLQGAEKICDQLQDETALARPLSRIKHKILIMSGKGGVGKSTVAVNLAFSLVRAGWNVGLLDVDIHGPNVPKMLGLEGAQVRGSGDFLKPVMHSPKLKLMSIGFMLHSVSDAVIWRGALKTRMIKQFLEDVEWGELDFLIIDAPPGTGDEPLTVCEVIGDADGAVIVTTPQGVALTDIRKSLTFCRQLRIPVLGVIENMSGFLCPHCGKNTDLFKSGGGVRVAHEMQVPFLVTIPIRSTVVDACDSGIPIVVTEPEGEVAKAFNALVEKLGFAREPAGGH